MFRTRAEMSAMHSREAGKPVVFSHVTRMVGFQALASLSRAAMSFLFVCLFQRVSSMDGDRVLHPGQSNYGWFSRELLKNGASTHGVYSYHRSSRRSRAQGFGVRVCRLLFSKCRRKGRVGQGNCIFDQRAHIEALSSRQ